MNPEGPEGGPPSAPPTPAARRDSSGALDIERPLDHARRLGFLGPGPVAAHLDHAEGFAEVIEARNGPPARFADLGTGGGVPGLVLAARWPAVRAVLVESNRRRAAFLWEAIATLGMGTRCVVLEERAETVAHDPQWREQFPVVTARSFAEPAVTAEIAAGLVAVGGILVVSEPPTADPARWPARPLALLGFEPAQRTAAHGAHFVVVAKTQAASDDVPRPVGRPAKRPRW